MLQENLILGRFERKLGGGTKRAVERRMPEDRVLKSSEGHFRNGVLDVKHLLHSGPSRNNESSSSYISKGQKKKGGGKNKRSKKGGGIKLH
ncbi:hypothetical protein CK203_114834 [Vitis vinifera]|uniref:Uncharacterized protein n=1 Tax=Vitis vinifera TaxID=29760 RepID=A0A438BNW5_VITVI|nr:hypothetical protein CK203_114834 [Vitis vinifera]